jgi:DNA polymerase-3 subunit beta
MASAPAPSFQVKRRDLLAAMDFAQAACERRSSLPYLKQLRGKANGRFTLDGSDLDMVARATIDCEGYPSQIVLPSPRLVRAALCATGGDTVSLAQSDPAPFRDESDKGQPQPDSHLAIVSGGVEATLVTAHPDAFQADDAIAEIEWAATISAGELAHIARVTGAISTEETRYYLNGVAVRKVAEWTWRFQATNGHVLKMVDIPLPDAEGTLPDLTILPRAFVHMLLSKFDKCKGPLRLTYGPKVLRNQPDGTTLDLQPAAWRFAVTGKIGNVDGEIVSRLIDGTYPDVDRVVPREIARSARFNRKALLQAINAVSAFSNERMRALRLTFNGDASVAISIESPVFGHAGMALECSHTVKGGQTVGFNGAYLADVVKSFRGEEVVISWADDTIASPPALFTDPEDTEFRCVVMPMRV